MRVSTQHLFESGGARIGELQASMLKTQQQIASGRRILSPADDPVGSARALDIAQTQALNTQFATNRVHAKNALGELDGVLGSVAELLQEVRTTTISARNGLLDDVQRGAIATGLQARFDQLLGLANSRDAVGNFMFSGFQTETRAFVASPTGATYQGDAGQRLIQVDSTRQLAANVTGQSVFQGGGQDVFQTLNDLVALLQTPVATPADEAALSAGLNTAVDNFDLALDSVSTARAATGTRLQEIDSLDLAGADRGVQFSQMLSEIQDLDLAKALTLISQQQVTLEAAQRSFVNTSNLSLFNFI